MLVKTLDGIESKWQMASAAATKKSGPHLAVREFLHEQFKATQILEEVQIEVKRNKYLYLDFYIPLYNIAVEIDGAQHREFNPFFGKNPAQFGKQKINDVLKSQWCEFNNITFIRLRDDEEENEWREKLME